MKKLLPTVLVATVLAGCSSVAPAPEQPSLAPASFATGRITPTPTPTPTPTSPLPDSFGEWTSYAKTPDTRTVIVSYARDAERKQKLSSGLIKTTKTLDEVRASMKKPETLGDSLCDDGNEPNLFVCVTPAPGGMLLTSGYNLTKAETAELSSTLAKLVKA